MANLKFKADFSEKSIRELNKRLKEIDPKLRTQLLRDVKAVGAPLQKTLQGTTSRIKPLSHMTEAGEFRRLVWGPQSTKPWGSVKPDTVKVQYRTAGSKRTSTTALLRLVLPHPLMAIGQYAGRSGRSINKGYKGSGKTRVYKWRTTKDGTVVERTHKINGQGRGMIREWRVQGMAYRAVENAIPQAKLAVKKIIEHYEQIASDKTWL